MSIEWTYERTAELTRLVKTHLSASEIASAMGEGFTRNSIIGKCHRLGLNLGDATRKPARFCRTPQSKPKTSNPPKPFKSSKPSKAARLFVGYWASRPEITPGHVPPMPVVEVPSLNIAFDDIGAFQCRWITNEQPALFCGHPAIVGSWCPAHRAVVFTPRTERRVSRKLEMAA